MIKPEFGSKSKEPSEKQGPLHIEKPSVSDVMPCMPKGVYKRASHNPNSRATQNYSIVEDLAQSSCAMSSLEVLQSFLVQQSALLSAIGATDASSSQLIMFDPSNVKHHLPYHVTFQIQVVYATKNIFRTMIDEGASNV
jgi:hypothetical protein